MNNISPRMVPGTIALYFTDEESPSLQEVHFRYDDQLGTIKSIRGRSTGAYAHTCNFLWSPAVRGLAALLLRTFEHHLLGGSIDALPNVSGESGTLASSLDYACAKNTSWLADMFGVDAEGMPYARKLILRYNPERKRPGPVVLSVNRLVLAPANISIYWQGNPVKSLTTLSDLLSRVESSKVVAKGLSGAEGSAKLGKPEQTDSFDSLPVSRSGYGNLPIARYHYLTETEDFEKEYLLGLEEGYLGRKFAFMGKGAVQTWLDICDSPNYTHFKKSLAAIESANSHIVERFKDLAHFIIISPGSGLKEAAVLRNLPHVEGRTICVVDSSHEILRFATPQLAPFCDRLELFYCEALANNNLTRIREYIAQYDSRPVGLMFLGNYFSAKNQRLALSRLQDGLRPDDLVLLDVQCNLNDEGSNIDEVFHNGVVGHDCPEFHRHLMLTLKPAGITFDDGVIEIEYGKDPILPFVYRISQFFQFNKRKELTYLGKRFSFVPGSRIEIASYVQYSLPVFAKIIKEHGFSIEWQHRADPQVILSILKSQQI